MSAEADLRYLLSLAQQHPEPSPSIWIGIAWQREDRQVTLSASGSSIQVMFASAARDVETLGEGAALIEAIFADTIVAVIGYRNGAPVYADLARPGDLAGGVVRLEQNKSAVDVPVMDGFQAISWSGEHDLDSEG